MLDVAAGHGRHARALCKAGFRVIAVDIDISGLEDLKDDPRVEIVAADLESEPWRFSSRRFDGIVVTNYLHRSHFPFLVSALADGGVLIFETFAQGNARLGRPRNPDFLLVPGDLLTAFALHLHVIAYEHGDEREPRPAVRQRICAVKGDGPYALGEGNIHPEA